MPGDGGPAAQATLKLPSATAIDNEGNLIIADSGNDRVRRVRANGVIETVAGGGTATSDGSQATASKLARPTGVAIDRDGNLLIAESRGGRVRKVGRDGVLTTVAGGGTSGSAGDGGPATQGTVTPNAIATDRAGNLYIVDSFANVVRKVSADGIISTFAGTLSSGFSGDGGPAVNARLLAPSGVAVDAAGVVYIADAGNHRLRSVSTAGIISTVTGGGARTEDGVPAVLFAGPSLFAGSVAVDAQGSLLITSSTQVYKVLQNGNIVKIAGSGRAAGWGDGGPALQAGVIGATGITADASGTIYLADSQHHAVRSLRRVDPVSIAAVVDAASEEPSPVTPGKIVVIYGVGLGPAQLVENRPVNGVWGTEVAGTRVQFNGIAAPILYSSATAVAAVVPYGIAGASFVTASVTYQGQAAAPFPVKAAAAAPAFFSLNLTGAGQIAAVNSDGQVNNALRPAKAGDYISLYGTGEGQTSPPGRDGVITVAPLNPLVVLPVKVTIGGQEAAVLYAGEAPASLAGLMQVVARIPAGVAAGGYVPVTMQVGDASTVDGAAWIAVAP